MIPKIIHYCWLSGDPIPANLQKCMESWKKNLSDYEFILWDLNRFDINQSLWVKQTFEAKKYAFAADYIRLYAIYHYGGIYMDMDVEVIKNFDSMLMFSYILGFESKEGIEAGILGAERGNPFIADCLAYYANRMFISNGQYDIKPLPTIMLDIAQKYYVCFERKSIEIENFQTKYLYIFPYEYLTAKSFDTGKVIRTENTYCIHHFAGSWLPSKIRFKQNLIWWLGEKWSRKLMNFKRNIIKLFNA